MALDKEKKRRKNKPNGYLQVWPTDMEDTCRCTTPSSELEAEANKANKTTRSVLSPREDTSSRKQRNKADGREQGIGEKPMVQSEKTGLNGRKITLLYEGSGDNSNDICIPQRAPAYLEGLTEDEIDLITNQISDFRDGKRSVSVQTEPVVVLGPNDPIPENKVEVLLKSIQHIQKKEILPILKEISGAQFTSALSMLKNVSDAISKRDVQSLLLTGLNQEEPLPVLRMRKSYSPVPDVDLLECLDTSISADLAVAAALDDSQKHATCASSSAPHASIAHVISVSTASLSTSPASSLCVSTPTSLGTSPASSLCASASSSTLLSTASVPSSSPHAATSISTPPAGEPTRSSPALSISRAKQSLRFECFPGPPLHEISNADDGGIPADAEVRIRNTVLSDILEDSCSRGNMAWKLTLLVFKPEELRGRNYKGGRNKPALSPRRRHAIEHGVMENYGITKDTLMDIYESVNTGLRNIKKRNRVPLIAISDENNKKY